MKERPSSNRIGLSLQVVVRGTFFAKNDSIFQEFVCYKLIAQVTGGQKHDLG